MTDLDHMEKLWRAREEPVPLELKLIFLGWVALTLWSLLS